MRESLEIIRTAGATPAGVVISLDRQERGRGDKSAIQEVQDEFGLTVLSVATLETLVAYLKETGAEALSDIEECRRIYGVA